MCSSLHVTSQALRAAEVNGGGLLGLHVIVAPGMVAEDLYCLLQPQWLRGGHCSCF